MKKQDVSVDEGANGTGYEDLKDFHDCDSLTRVKADESGDNACMAHMAEGRAYPCWATNVGKLLDCRDYTGPLSEALELKRKAVLLK